MEIYFSNEIKQAAPGYRLIKIEADVVNAETQDELWNELGQFADSLKSLLEISDINKRPGIAATRAAYKACGKDPNRYRPSTEQLCRRILKDLSLYRVNAIVDAFNLLSLKSGHSIGAFDRDAIQGSELTLGIGRAGEPYEGIGRGMLNIEGMPVWRDSIGGIGTPTSDNERTKVSMETCRLLVTINMYGEDMPVEDIEAEAIRLLETYCAADNIKISVIGQ